MYTSQNIPNYHSIEMAYTIYEYMKIKQEKTEM